MQLNKKPFVRDIQTALFLKQQLARVIMKNFKVDVQFKKQGCFGVEVTACDKREAEQKAVSLARGCGFDGAVKKVNVRES